MNEASITAPCGIPPHNLNGYSLVNFQNIIIVSGTSSDVPRECYPLFSCSNRFLDIGKFFYDGDTLKDVSEETVDELCQYVYISVIR